MLPTDQRASKCHEHFRTLFIQPWSLDLAFFKKSQRGWQWLVHDASKPEVNNKKSFYQ